MNFSDWVLVAVLLLETVTVFLVVMATAGDVHVCPLHPHGEVK